MEIDKVLKKFYDHNGPQQKQLKANTVLYRGVSLGRDAMLRANNNEAAWFFPESKRDLATGYALTRPALPAKPGLSYLLKVVTSRNLSINLIELFKLTNACIKFSHGDIQSWQKTVLLPSLTTLWNTSGTYDNTTGELWLKPMTYEIIETVTLQK